MKNIELLFNKFVGALHEADEPEEQPAVVQDGQEVLAQDVRETPGVYDQAPQEELPPEELPPEEDPSAQDEFAPPALPEMSDPNISETQKSINLLNLYLTLKQNVEKLKDLFEECDFTSIDVKFNRELNEIEESIDDLYHKVVVYITDNFPSEKYEKSLYVYIMLRNELLEVSKILNETFARAKKEKSDD